MKAMILSAGYGTRLGDLTRDLPKPMLPIQGHPLLAYLITNLAKHGFREIMINLHFLPEMIRDYFQDGGRFGVRLHYSYEETLLGTAGGVKKAEKFFAGEQAFLVHYGDVLTDQDFSELAAFHQEKKALATLLLHQRTKSNSVVSLDTEQRIIGFLERPTDAERQGIVSPWVNSGICICSNEILGKIPEGTASDLPRDIFVKCVAGGRLYGFPLSGYRCAIDSPARLDEARKALADGSCSLTVTNPPDKFREL